ncbi:MAG: hypothetical protein AAF267_09005 [Deinococcota bacterium]
MEKQRLYSVIASLPSHLQSKVYDYALSLQNQGADVAQATPLILDMHKDALVIAEDFDEPLPNDFWLGTSVSD